MYSLAEMLMKDGHNLKTWPNYFQAIWVGLKTFDIRRNDRNFKVGDWLNLIEYDPDKNDISGRVIRAHVPYVLTAEQFPFLHEGYVCMSLEHIQKLTFSGGNIPRREK